VPLSCENSFKRLKAELAGSNLFVGSVEPVVLDPDLELLFIVAILGFFHFILISAAAVFS
jgi:hypothetical protein